MKNRIMKLLFGSVTRELLFAIVLSVVSISLFFDVIPRAVANAMPNAMPGLMPDAASSIMFDVIPGIAVIFIISTLVIKRFKDSKTIVEGTMDNEIDSSGHHGVRLQRRMRKALFASETEELLLTVLLLVISFRVLSNKFTILLLIYLLVRRKAEYIKCICNGIKIISKGNLNYKIKIKGHDELAILAKEINNMSRELQNKIEEERAAERLKNELVTNVSHDLRTPLTALIGYVQLAADDNASFEDKDKYARIALEKSQKLKVLIDDLFEYSKLESGGIKLEKAKVNMMEIIEQSIGELSIQAKERHVRFNKNFENSKVELMVDPCKMARVFENVIGNAVKYSVQGSSVNINSYENNGKVILCFENVVDSIPEEDLEKIFNRFYRTDESRNSEIAGSGLGLAIARSIVKMHKGKIWAEREADKFMIKIELNKDWS